MKITVKKADNCRERKKKKLISLHFQTRLSKILQVKKDWINQLSDMNTIAEKKVGTHSVACFCSSVHAFVHFELSKKE